MITGIGISNFKSIEVDQIKLKPLTILTGKNSSGKSNILEAISFFGQAARWINNQQHSNHIAEIFRYGEIIKYPYKLEDSITFKRETKRNIELTIEVETNKQLTTRITEIANRETNAKEYFKALINRHIKTVGYSVKFNFQDDYFAQKFLVDKKPILEIVQEMGKQPRITYPKDYVGIETTQTLSRVFDQPKITVSSRSGPFDKQMLGLTNLIVTYIQKFSERIYFISGERGEIKSAVEISDKGSKEDPSWIGFNGQHLVDILSICFTTYPEKASKIREWAKKFQLPDINAGYVGKGALAANFKDDVLETNVNSNLAGLGSRQILSIISQIFWCEPNDTILIEEPEISLHPENQVLLHQLFSEAVSEGKQIICSTHSPFFILALSKIIKNELINLEDIAVYEIEKTVHGTKHKEIKINKHGFIEGGIPSFMKVEEELFSDWSESLEEEQ
jgi:predicted ATPase